MPEVNDTDWRTKGGQAKSKKKTTACRRNARKPRPGRSEFNRVVRKVVDEYPQLASQSTNRVMSEIIFKFDSESFRIDNARAERILNAAIKRQKA